MTTEEPRHVPAPPRDPNEIDYTETEDVTQIHAPVRREKTEPWYANVPLPLWLIIIVCIPTAMAFYYLGRYSGGFSAEVYNELQGIPGATTKAGGAQAAGPAQPETPAELGKEVFTQNCALCHQASGLGVPGQFPPLVASEFVNGGTRRLGMIVLKGVQGPFHVKGTLFNGAMPSWEKSLNDKKISAVLTYIRQEWGNKGGPVEIEPITKLRKELDARSDAWTEADLLAVPADANLEGAKDQAQACRPGSEEVAPAGDEPAGRAS